METSEDEDALRNKQFEAYRLQRLQKINLQLGELSSKALRKLKLTKDSTIRINLLNRFDETKQKMNLISLAKEKYLLETFYISTPASEKTIQTKPTNIQLYSNLLRSTKGEFTRRRNLHYKIAQDTEISVCREDHCKLFASATYPFCLHHLQEKFGLIVRNSFIPGAGLGLFAEKSFKKGEQIYFLDVSKLIYSKKEIDQTYGDYEAPYTWSHGNHICFDDFFTRTFIGCANGQMQKEQQNIENVMTVNKKSVFSECYAVKDISAGEELITNYGPDYHFKKYSSYLV